MLVDREEGGMGEFATSVMISNARRGVVSMCGLIAQPSRGQIPRGPFVRGYVRG